MLIKEMIIQNFRQYRGEQKIVFSTDKEKNVTLFLGDNGAGKTVISQAFMWCFYGETPAFSKKDSLLCKVEEDEMYDGWDREVKVSIQMEHADCEYTVERKIKFSKNDGKVSSSATLFTINKTDCKTGKTDPLRGKDLEKCINEILPIELSQYFFLSGEKIDSMSSDIKSGRPKDFANAVNTLLDLDYYKNAIKHLTAISKEYDTEPVAGREDIERINNIIENSQKNLDTFNSQKDEISEKIQNYNEIIIDCQTQLKSMTSSKEIQTKIEALERKIKNAEFSINSSITSVIKKFVEKTPFSYMTDVINEMNDTLKEVTSTTSENIPERLHAELIDWIEKRGECICGNKISKGDKCFDLLEKWRNIVPPESIGIIAKQMSSKAQDKLRLGKGLKDDIRQNEIGIQQYNSDIEEYEDEIEELKFDLSKASDTTSIQQQLYNAQEEVRNSEKQKEFYTTKIAELELEIKQKKREKEQLIKDSKEGQKIIACKEMTESLLESFTRRMKEDENEKRELLLTSVKKAFREIYGDSFSITIDENYKIKTDSSLERSTGQGMSVIFSFLAGLLDVIKTDKGKKITNGTEHIKLESYPLVLDAPFSALDKKRITSICKVLPKVSEQIIIFIKDTDGNLAKQEMQGKIGASYKLEKVGNTDMETKIVSEQE